MRLPIKGLKRVLTGNIKLSDWLYSPERKKWYRATSKNTVKSYEAVGWKVYRKETGMTADGTIPREEIRMRQNEHDKFDKE